MIDLNFSHNTVIIWILKNGPKSLQISQNRLISKNFTNFIEFVVCISTSSLLEGSISFDVTSFAYLRAFFSGIFRKSDQKLKTFEILSFKL